MSSKQDNIRIGSGPATLRVGKIYWHGVFGKCRVLKVGEVRKAEAGGVDWRIAHFKKLSN